MPGHDRVRLLPAILLLVAALAGCGGSREPDAAVEERSATTTEETAGAESPPRSFEDVMARLPPFDEPASEDVDAYRRATIGAFFERCIPGTGGADEAEFVRANTRVLDSVATVPGAEQTNEYSIDHRDGNGCIEGTGPPTSYTTYRSFRLPPGTSQAAVIAHFERELAGWGAGAATTCERTFTRGEAYVAVSACSGGLRLTARGRGPVDIPPSPPLPPRPYGAQYPIATSYGTAVEPTSYGVEPGDTCERISSGDVPSTIVPPSPGIRARFSTEPLQLGTASFERHIVVEWWYDRILGDCPPTRLMLSIASPKPGTVPPLTLNFDVRTRSGTERLPVLETLRDAYVLRAATESLDGSRSRTVAVLISPPA